MTKPHIEVYERYRIDSGNRMPKLGTVDYAMTTKTGAGYGFCESGKHFLVTENISYESVGNNLPQNSNANQPHQPAKWIHAKNGDIVIQAPNGTIYLEARNIILDAVGSESSTQKNGNVFLQASNEVYIKSSDKVTIAATDVLINASKTATIVGKCFLNMTGGMVNSASSVDTFNALSILDTRVMKLITALGLV
jgi:hypothetical protein